MRYCHNHLMGMFPHMPGQSGFSKRVRQAGGLIAAVLGELARDIGPWCSLLLVDSTPIP